MQRRCRGGAEVVCGGGAERRCRGAEVQISDMVEYKFREVEVKSCRGAEVQIERF